MIPFMIYVLSTRCDEKLKSAQSDECEDDAKMLE